MKSYSRTALFVVAAAILVLSVASFGNLAAQEEKDTVNKVIQAWRNRQERVRSGHFVMEESRTFAEGTLTAKANSFRSRLLEPGVQAEARNGPFRDTTVEVQSILSFEGDRMRYTIKGPQWAPEREEFLESTYLSVFDGSLGKTFYSDSADEKLFPLGFIDVKTDRNPDAKTCYLYALFMNYRPFHPTMGQFSSQGWTTAGKGVVDGKDCLIVENVGSSWTKSCWVDPARDYIILRYTNRTTRGGKDVSKLDISYINDKKNGWIPSRWKAVLLFPERGTLDESSTTTVSSYTINPSFEPSEFQIDFPVGTFVRHYQEPDQYLVDKNGGKRIVTQEELNRNVTYAQLRDTPSGMAGLVSRRRVWPALLVGTLFILFAALMWRRRRTPATDSI